MALENLKKEMLASINQYKNFVEMELERLEIYTTTLNANESINFIIISLIIRLAIVSSSS